MIELQELKNHSTVKWVDLREDGWVPTEMIAIFLGNFDVNSTIP